MMLASVGMFKFCQCRIQEHTLLPNETMYTRSYFPLPQDKDYYIVGFLAKIVNKIHTHHFVAYFCTADINQLYDPPQEAGFPEQPKNETDIGMASRRYRLYATVSCDTLL
jgi:hypothetical protein